MRSLVWIALALVLVWLIQGFAARAAVRRNGRSDGRQRSGQEPPAQAAGSNLPEKILECQHCRVHVPATEAVTDPSGAVFCSQEHRLLHFPGD